MINKLITSSVFESLDYVQVIIRCSDQDGEFTYEFFMVELTGELEDILSNTKNLLKSIKLFLNPSDGLINISSFISILEMQLFDACGKLIKHFNQEELLELYDLESGIYFLQIKTTDGVLVKQILLKD